MRLKMQVVEKKKIFVPASFSQCGPALSLFFFPFIKYPH